MRFFICIDYLSGRSLIIALDVIETMFEKTKTEYMTQWENFEIPEDEQEMFEAAPEKCTMIQTKTGGTYYIRNTIDDIVEFIKGTNNG